MCVHNHHAQLEAQTLQPPPALPCCQHSATPCTEHRQFGGIYSLWLNPLYRAVILHIAYIAQQLPSFPHAGLHVAQLFVGLVEDF